MSDTLEESRPAHAPLGPSSADGWSTCAGYVNANRGLPDFSSEAAAEGTAAHAISDICLATGLDAADFLGMVTRIGEHVFAWEEDDAALLQGGLDETRELVGSSRLFGEQRVDTSECTLPGQFGTLDRAWVMHDAEAGEWWVCISDLKWGRGVPVSPVENRQLMLYALAFWHDVARHQIPAGVKPRFQLIIDQPRHSGGGGVWNTTLDAMLAFGAWIKERAGLTADPDAPRTASLAGCRWCRRRRVPGPRGGCDTYDTFMVELLGLTWDDIDLGIAMTTEPDLARVLTPDRRSYLLLHKDAIRRWLDQLDEETMADALAGTDTGLVKAVEGNKLPDKWRDKGVAATPVVERLLGDQGFTKRLKTPKQIATAVEGDAEASAAIAELVDRGKRKPILVPLDDARRPVTTAASFDG